MAEWKTAQNDISDIKDWAENKRLELQPPFQRREVWSPAARQMLMDTVFQSIPMPKIFLANKVIDKKTHRIVIDGQQRISAILAFLRDDFPLANWFPEHLAGKFFSELDEEDQNLFLSYSIDFNAAKNPSEAEVREVYSRVNKYTVALTKQELRRADYPGDFLTMCERYASNDFFEDFKIFTAANIRRYADVEFISELFAALLGGIQDKKGTLDDFYIEYAQWDKKHQKIIETLFNNTLDDISSLLNSFDRNPVKSRFKQKADFYSLFFAIAQQHSQGYTLKGKSFVGLVEDMEILDDFIRPESPVNILSEYAIKCVSQANSASSRRWRHEFLNIFLNATYQQQLPNENQAKVYYQIWDFLNLPEDVCPGPSYNCPVCEFDIEDDFDDCVMGWGKDNTSFHVSNALCIHNSCLKDAVDLVWIERPREDEDD